jgi:hypothetical protein
LIYIKTKRLNNAILVFYYILIEVKLMSSEILAVNCESWKEIANENPTEMEVVMELMIEAGEALCTD